MMLFGIKYSHELSQTFLKENWGGEKKQQTDFAVGYHNKYATFSPNARRLREGLKQGPFISSQHSSLLTELMG